MISDNINTNDMNLLEVLLEMYKNTIYELEALNGMAASVYVTCLIENLFEENDISFIDNLLETIDIDKLTNWSMVALLRTTFSAKHLLQNWKRFYESTYNVLTDRGFQELHKELYGLDKE